ncbi:unnamed protein product [Effrenium voratum]|nr:unnamed protein product [Effrenium voratum]
MVVVRQGRNRYKVRVRQGLDKASFGELADYLVAQMLPPGIPACELRLISKGKTAAREDPLGAADGKELSVMLMFREGFHLAVEGDRWMQEKSEELSQAEAKIASLSKRVEANFSDAETSLQLAEVSGFVETLLQSVDSVRLNSTKLPAMQELRDRAVKAEERGYLSFAEVRSPQRLGPLELHGDWDKVRNGDQDSVSPKEKMLLQVMDRLSGIDLRGTFDLDGTGMVSTAVLRRSLATFDPQVFSDECLDLLLRPSCANGERSVHILDVFGPFWQPFCHRLQQLQEKVAQTKRQAQKRQVQLAQTAQDTTEELRAQLEMARQSRRSGEAEPDRQMLELRGRLLECEQEKLRLEEQLAQGPTLLGGPAEVTALPKGKSFQTELGNTGLRRKRTAWREESDTTDLAQQLLKASEQNRKTLEAEVRKALGRLEQALSRMGAVSAKPAMGEPKRVYINHGGGPLPLLQKQPSISKFLGSYAASLPRPSAVLVVTAHWETDALKVSAGKSHSLYFDYGGFPKETYEYTYPAPGSPELANRIIALLANKGLECSADATRGWDHGVFVPMMLMFPDASIPIVSLSLYSSQDAAAHITAGEALQPLRDEGVLIVGSGASFHNFKHMFGRDDASQKAGQRHAKLFDTWLVDSVDSELSPEERRHWPPGLPRPQPARRSPLGGRSTSCRFSRCWGRLAVDVAAQSTGVERENHQLQQELAAAQTELTQSRSVSAALTAAKEELAKCQSDKEAQLATAARERQEVQEELARLEGASATQREAFQQQQQRLQEALGQTEDLRAALQQSSLEAELLRQQQGAASARLAELDAESERRRRSEEAAKAMEARVVQLEEEVVVTRETMAAREREAVEAVHHAVARTRAEAEEQMGGHLGGLEAQLQATATKLQQAEEDKEELTGLVGQVSTELKQLQRDLKGREEQVLETRQMSSSRLEEQRQQLWRA